GKVDGDALAVAANTVEVRARLPRRRVGADVGAMLSHLLRVSRQAHVRVPALDGLDADDLGAEVAEEGGAERAGPDHGDVDDANAGKGKGRHQMAPCALRRPISPEAYPR